MTAHIRVPALDDVPATTSRVILHDLLREELGFEGMVMTDALEMRAISATVGVEEGAVQALAAGADALCLGHDLGDESVESITAAVVESVRTGRLPESRLVEAADRVHRVADWASHAASRDRIPVDIGRLAARRALRKEGTTALSGAPLVVEFGPEPSIAAGKSPGPGEWLRRVLPEADVVRVSEAQTDLRAVENGAGRPLVIIARDAHRHEWQRASIETLLKKGGDVVVVEVGLPHWRPTGAAGYIATYGAGRVNLEAAAALLVR
jgi:beta-N-acetylhexosaminidase